MAIDSGTSQMQNNGGFVMNLEKTSDVTENSEEKTKKSKKNEEEIIKKISISAEDIKNIDAEYEKRRKEILAKHPDDVETPDLAYINMYDPIASKLPFKFRRILQRSEHVKAIFGQIKEIIPLLRDESVNEINLNQDGRIWISKYGQGKFETNIELEADKAENMIKMIATFNNDQFDKKTNPIISSNLPSGERIECLAGDIVGGMPVFSLRKRPSRIFPLDEYVERGQMTQTQKEAILKEMELGHNILLVGATGTGKTTFCNACLHEMKKTTKRILVIEDTPELICDCEDKVMMTTTEFVGFPKLLKSTMRLNGNVVILGEMRDGEAVIILFKIWNMGAQGGLSTVHADSAEKGLRKLEQYASEVSPVSQVENIINSVHTLVCLQKRPDESNYVSQVARVKGYNYQESKYILEDIA